MQNYGEFIQICVLQEFREKKLKSKKKIANETKKIESANLAKVGSGYCRDKTKNCHDKEMNK